MISEKLLIEDYPDNYSHAYESEIKRLQSTLQGRLNLLNLFKPLTNKNHALLKFENIGIDTESEYEIVQFLSENSKHVESFYRESMDEWFMKNGTKWQKERVSMGKKIKGIPRNE